jgi:O-6-methylguanine DNA methyltransferase
MRLPESLQLVRLSIATREGGFLADYSAKGLAQLHFPAARATHRPAAPGCPAAVIRSWHRLTKAALLAILAGRAPRSFPPLDLSAGTPFQQTVWRALGKIPVGQTLSYGEIARAIGKPKAVRAVGGACGANPIPVLVPCHRVVAANGKLGGFSGGLDWKRTLLEHEGVKLN